VRAILGVAPLSTGAALVAYILAGFSLVLGLMFAAVVIVAAVGLVWQRAGYEERGLVARTVGVGALAGVIATAGYDVAKLALSRFDPVAYDPFAVLAVFGLAIAGPATPASAAYLIGTIYHVLNGVAFGIGFAFLLGTRGIAAGVLYGLFLEVFMLALFPGWLNVKAWEEFARVSALSHVVYGAVLGAMCRRWLDAARPWGSSNTRARHLRGGP
jgi:hypothetical protein